MVNAGTVTLITVSSIVGLASIILLLNPSIFKPQEIKKVKEVDEFENEGVVGASNINKQYVDENKESDNEVLYEFQGGSTNVKLIKIVPSQNKDKKWTAIFSDNGRTKSVSFGARGMEDYTQHKDKERRKRYLERHEKDLKTNDPTRAGYLSYYVLWGPSTSLQENIRQYKNKFNL